MTLPLTENFRANSYFKGFVINAIVGAIITVLAIELRLFLEDKTSSYYGFWSSIYKTKTIDESKNEVNEIESTPPLQKTFEQLLEDYLKDNQVKILFGTNN